MVQGVVGPCHRPLPAVVRVDPNRDPAHYLLLQVHQSHQLHWIIPLAPRVEAAFQRTHSGDSVPLELQRRTGAGGFVWSSAVEDDIAIAGDLQMPFLQLLAIEPDRAGDFCAVGCVFFRSTQVEDYRFIQQEL
jgi:hypothetical protein